MSNPIVNIPVGSESENELEPQEYSEEETEPEEYSEDETESEEYSEEETEPEEYSEEETEPEQEEQNEEEDSEEEEQPERFIPVMDLPRVLSEKEAEKGEASNAGEDGESSQRNKWKNRGDIDGLFCPICMEAWTTAGDHHVCCLPCGHIFGSSCIQKWLEHRGTSKKCPQCNRKCTSKDLRKLYASRIIAIDGESQKRIQSLEAKCISLEKKDKCFVTLEQQHFLTLHKKLQAVEEKLDQIYRSSHDHATLSARNFQIMAQYSLELAMSSTNLRADAFPQPPQFEFPPPLDDLP